MYTNRIKQGTRWFTFHVCVKTHNKHSLKAHVEFDSVKTQRMPSIHKCLHTRPNLSACAERRRHVPSHLHRSPAPTVLPPSFIHTLIIICCCCSCSSRPIIISIIVTVSGLLVSHLHQAHNAPLSGSELLR